MCGLFAFKRLMDSHHYNLSMMLGSIVHPCAHFLRLRKFVNYGRPAFRPSDQQSCSKIFRIFCRPIVTHVTLHRCGHLHISNAIDYVSQSPSSISLSTFVYLYTSKPAHRAGFLRLNSVQKGATIFIWLLSVVETLRLAFGYYLSEVTKYLPLLTSSSNCETTLLYYEI